MTKSRELHALLDVGTFSEVRLPMEPEVEISVTRYVRFFVLVLVWVYFETTYENLRLLARDLMDFRR